MKILKTGLALLLIAALALPAWASETAIVVEETVCRVETLPADWNPLTAQSAAQKLLLELTGDRLYGRSADGTIVPSLAAGLPVDVTAKFAGDETYGVPGDAVRGYAFQIDLIENAKWEDGTAITADDYLFTLETLVRNGGALPLANLEAYRAGKCRDAETIISLGDAGYSSEAAARAAGITSFYLDTEGFWGLGGGWQPIESRSRLRDYAMPAGLDEYFVTPAYLYGKYLADGTSYSRWQEEFLGISTASDDFYTIADVGFEKTGTYQITLILSQPATASSLALMLEDIYLIRESVWGDGYAESTECYSSCGPYRISSVTGEEILLEANPYWHGPPAETDRIHIRPVA